ncbi:hypothetical protein CK203_099749 [Vitis vinifera]|uniref:Uncharacterized protein n=1 Tax=Vitis vinifera TaxID=29760 RepID=A0A438CYR9_VITVI|nr:hypothetical protein CK203_099749 [Vitis vinifera]
MHYRQLMTLDIGNDALLCKVFPQPTRTGPLMVSSPTSNSVGRTSNRGLQHGCVLQIFKRSICPGTPFFESLAKKPPTTMDDLFRRANKYSMLEDDVRAATQQVLVAGRPARNNTEGSNKPPDRPKPSDRKQEGPNGLDPLERTHPQGIVAGDVPSTRSWPYNRDMPIFPVSGRKAHKSRAFEAIPPQMGRDVSQHNNPGAQGPSCPKAVINYITEAVRPTWCKHQSLATWDIVSRALKTRTNLIRIQRIINHILGRYHTAGPSWPSHSQRTVFSSTGVITLQCHFGAHMAPLHESYPLYIHQMVSFLTNDGQIDLYGSQLAARQCYQIAREAGANQEDASPPEPSIAHDQ